VLERVPLEALVARVPTCCKVVQGPAGGLGASTVRITGEDTDDEPKNTEETRGTLPLPSKTGLNLGPVTPYIKHEIVSYARGSPENLFDWNYWRHVARRTEVLLTRANAADRLPRAQLTRWARPDLRFEDARE